MKEAYWNEMFGEFKVDDRRFRIPGLEEPLMSPDFEKRNLIGNFPGNVSKRYILCEYGRPKETQRGKVQARHLKDEVHSEKFWEYQLRHNRDSFEFLQRLLFFLVAHKKPHFHFYIEREGEVVASTIAGVCQESAFFFNLSVRNDLRQNGLAKNLLLGARSMLSDRETFYWTSHPWLTLNADRIKGYCIV